MNHSMTATHEERLQAMRARQRAAEAERERREAATPVQLFLPGFEDTKRAIPNHIARSSLFAPISKHAKKEAQRKMYHNTLLQSRGDVEIRFSGRQLDETQADVWMQLIKLAVQQTLGEPIRINRADFLRELGKPRNGRNYEWLHRAFDDLDMARLKIVITRKNGRRVSIGNTENYRLIRWERYDEQAETYTVIIDSRTVQLFGRREYALIDWQARLAIGRNQDTAKALQRLIATDKETVQRYALAHLKKLFCSEGSLRDFRAAIRKACDELKRDGVGVIAEWKLGTSMKGEEQLTVWRVDKQPQW